MHLLRSGLKFVGVWSALVLLGSLPAHAQYFDTAAVTFQWGTAGGEKVWTSSGPNTLSNIGNFVSFDALPGSNAVYYFNSNFASATQCNALVLAADPLATAISTKKYGCTYVDEDVTTQFLAIPVVDPGPAGGTATGTLTVTDTTLTGTLFLIPSTDEPTGGTATSVGNGASGYNVRFADGGPLGNGWWGVSANATLTVNLTGNFTPSSWVIFGGSVTFNDPGFLCQALIFAPFCSPSSAGGGYQPNGAHLSWGMDPDGAGTAFTEALEFPVFDASGTTLLSFLSGVLASGGVDVGGNVFLVGETRRGWGSLGGGCANSLRWDGTRISCGTLQVTDLVITGVVTGGGFDSTPDPFLFVDETGVPLSSVRTSNTITVTGIDTSAFISVVGGSYSINSGAFTTLANWVQNGDTVRVQHVSAATPGAVTDTTLTIDAVSDTFSSTTVVADTTPDPFSFVDQGSVATNAAVTSAPVSITGINSPAPISIAGHPSSQYSIGCTGTFTATAGVISNGASVCVRHTSAGSGGLSTDTVLTVGGISDTFTSTTAVDGTPNAFAFSDAVNVALSTGLTSNAVSINGINVPVAVGVSGDPSSQYSIGCTEPYTSSPGTVTNWAIVCVRHTSAAVAGASVSTTLTAGGIADTFTSTTQTGAPPLDTSPDEFAFPGQVGVPLATVITSAPVTITGITAPVDVVVAGGGGSEYSIGCTGSFTSAPGTLSNGQSVCVRHTSSASNGMQVNTFLAVGDAVGLFSTITVLADPVVSNDAVPPPSAGTDPPVILFDKTEPSTSNTIQSIGVEPDGVVAGGLAQIGFCAASDPREGELSPGVFNPRPLPLSELAGTCSSLAGETLVIPAYMRAFPDVTGARRFVISTAGTTADLEGMLLSQGYPDDLVSFPGGAPPPCNAALESRPLWLWGVREGEDVVLPLTDEDEEMKPVSIQCNYSRSGTRRLSNFVFPVRLDESILSSESYLAAQLRDQDKILAKLAIDDDRCGPSLPAVTAALQGQAAICRSATVNATIRRDTSVAERRITRTLYEYTMRISLTNSGGAVSNATAVVRSNSPGTTVVGGSPLTLNFGNIGAGATTAEQVFKIRQNRSLVVDPGVIVPSVTFTADPLDTLRFSNARVACEEVARIARNNRAAFAGCPADVRAKKYRGALISSGLGAAFTIWDRLEHPSSYVLYPLPPDIVPPEQIPPD